MSHFPADCLASAQLLAVPCRGSFGMSIALRVYYSRRMSANTAAVQEMVPDSLGFFLLFFDVIFSLSL
jgi:hypothetical protein